MMAQTELVKLVAKIIKTIDNDNCDQSQLQCDVRDYANFVKTICPSVAQCTLPILVTPFLTLHAKQDEYRKFSEELKILLLNVLQVILSKSKLDNEKAFSLLFDFLLVQLIDSEQVGIVVVTSEEHKLAVLTCFETLFTSLSWDLLPVLYTEKHVPKLCLLLHTCLDVLKKEKSRALRLSALECIMKTAKVDDSSDLEDVLLLSQIGSIFLKFLPGIAACLIVVAVEDNRCGHNIVSNCVKAWARLVSVLMRSYDPMEPIPKLEDCLLLEHANDVDKKEHLVHDEKLALCANLLMKLAAYDHAKVRKQLAESAQLLASTCFLTLPATIPKVIEILIVLSEDCDEGPSSAAKAALVYVGEQLAEDSLRTKALVDNLHQSFQQHLTQTPRIFNGLDGGEQLTAINLLVGYLKLFAQSSKLKSVLFEETSLNRLIGCLLHVAQVDRGNVSLLEEYTLHDWEATPDRRTPWKSFKFNDRRIQDKLEEACHLLARPMVVDIVLDYLLEVFCTDCERKAEATLLANEILSAQDEEKAKDVLDVYLEEANWRLPLSVEGRTVLRDVQVNVLQLCLQLEGIGKIALAIGKRFRRFLLKVLYVVLEKAGSAHPLLQAAGLACTANISMACGYASVTDLINRNADYFAYNVTNKLRRRSENASVLNVLAVVMRHSNMDVLPSISDIVEGVLLQSCDKFQQQNAAAYLQVFAAFVKSMHAWLDVRVADEPMISKREQEERREALRRQQWEELSKPVDLSDAIMGKTAEELYEEDLEEREQEIENEEAEVQKPLSPPKHIQLVVKILERSLNFLPAKDANCKILTLDILRLGVQVLKEFEDELLPIVHKVWSPLVNRFKDISTPLVVNLSFTLLSTLGRLSKDFIRMRTVKEVLPSINDVLVRQSKESYLKDRGSAYRYTQGYKMQLNILSGLGRLAYDLELDDKIDVVLPGVESYLTEKQPAPLQTAAVNFYRDIVHYSPENGQRAIDAAKAKYQQQQDWNKNLNILLSITQVRK